jgi:hypothetical protein
MTNFKVSAACLAVGLMALTTPALAQQQVTPKSGPDVNQPKYVPGTTGTPGESHGAMGNNRGSGVDHGGGKDGASGTTGSGTGASGNSGSGGTGTGTGGSGTGGTGGSGGSNR